FGAIPESLPEAGERRLGTVGSNVGGPLTQLGGQLEENRGLPHLARPGHELDASGRGLGQAAAEGLPTAGVVEMGQIARHGRIIIRLYPEHQTRVRECAPVPGAPAADWLARAAILRADGSFPSWTSPVRPRSPALVKELRSRGLPSRSVMCPVGEPA